MPSTASSPPPVSEWPEDEVFSEKVDRVETGLIDNSVSVLGSGIGLASIVAAIAGPEGAILGALVGAIAGLVLPRLNRHRSQPR